MNERDEVLVHILALTDTAFLPVRRWAAPRSVSAVYEARQAYISEGVPWRVGGAPAERQRAGRVLGELQDACLVTVFRNAVRATSVRLGDYAEALARALADLPSLADSRELLRRVAAFQDACEEAGGTWENWLAGVKWSDTEAREERRKLVAVEEKALPALARGWLATGSTIRGHVRYAATEAGRDALDQESAPEPEDLPAADVEARATYYRELEDARAALRAKTPDRAGQVGMIPIPLCYAGRDAPECELDLPVSAEEGK